MTICTEKSTVYAQNGLYGTIFNIIETQKLSAIERMKVVLIDIKVLCKGAML